MIQQPLRIALVGNPNTGKTTLFNQLTGLRQKVANYPGITVERKAGTSIMGGILHTVIDLPGAYSLNHKKLDERIAYHTLIGLNEVDQAPDLIVFVADSTHLERNLFLLTQILDLGIPTVLVLNMADLARQQGIELHEDQLSERLGIPVFALSAHQGKEITQFKDWLSTQALASPEPLTWITDPDLTSSISELTEHWISPHTNIPDAAQCVEASRMISDAQLPDPVFETGHKQEGSQLINTIYEKLLSSGKNPAALEMLQRYAFVDEVLDQSYTEMEKSMKITERIDTVVTHPVAGPAIFLGLLLLMFQAIFSWATPFMDLIDLLFVNIGNAVAGALPPGMLNDLLVEGVIAGLGGVVIFLPQILFLFFFIYTLEGTGYMARAAFVMDGFMARIGLHGRSVVPLMSGFACAIPGIMAARTIENWKERIITIMVLPFMACSARLPVYAILISAFVPATPVLGIFTYQGMAFFGLYLFGILVAILSAVVMKWVLKSDAKSPFLMELPDYKLPKWKLVVTNSLERGKIFVTEAGKVIMVLSIILWFLASFPRVEIPSSGFIGASEQPEDFYTFDTEESYQLRNSFAGNFGQLIEPVIEPLGFDWRIGIGLITSFAAREVMVGTLSTIYSIGDDDEAEESLKEKLVNDINPKTGKPTYTLATAVSLMIFFALAMQCLSTVAIVKRETNSWKWPLIMVTYMTVLAYISSFFAYQWISSL
ncbi:MAG: ferrous iron transport protein B [Bacteroidota bacterium]